MLANSNQKSSVADILPSVAPPMVTIGAVMARRIAVPFCLALAVFASGCSRPVPARVRLVLVTLDTLRYDVFAGGALRAAMPRLLERARRGTRFSHFYAATSTTEPSHATMFTGLHPWQHGVVRNGEVLAGRFRTVAEVLREAGFETRAVVASYPLAAEFGFAQGFDAFYDRFTTGVRGARVWEGHTLPSGRFFSRADAVTAHALEALDAARGRRQFFWFHYFDPHAPYGSSRGKGWMESDVFRRVAAGEPASDVIAEVRRRYREDASYLDRELDRLLARLESDAGRYETHVLVVADHGERLGEADSVGHGYGLDPVEIRVPALILSPKLPPGVREDVAGSIDVAPTLVALAGVDATWPGGRDLVRGGASARPPGALGMRRTFRARQPGERLLDGSVRPIPPLLFYAIDADGRTRLFDGRRLLGPPAPDDAAQRERFRAFERELAEHTARGALDPAVGQRLRALGYAP